jgi:hypothetical protein
MAVAQNYVEKFDSQIPGKGLHVALMDLKRLRARTGVKANIRSERKRGDNIIARISGSTTLVWGWAQTGESVGGNNVWYRVWVPTRSRVGYVHSSVVHRV